MAKEKETQKMADPNLAVPAVESTELKPKQTVLNLDTFVEEDVTLSYPRYSLNKKATVQEQLKELLKLATPEEKRVQALLYGLNNWEYTEAKTRALAADGKNYLTTQLRSKISQVMGQLEAYEALSAKECFERWLAAYKIKKPSAIKLLERIKATEEFGDM